MVTELVCGRVRTPAGAAPCNAKQQSRWKMSVGSQGGTREKHRFWGPTDLDSNLHDFGQVIYLL